MLKPFPILETNRLVLRQLRHEDAADVFSYFARDEVTQYYDLGSFTEQRQAEELIQQWNDRFTQSEGIRWGITRKGEDRIIGKCGFHKRQHQQALANWRLFVLQENSANLSGMGYNTNNNHVNGDCG